MCLRELKVNPSLSILDCCSISWISCHPCSCHIIIKNIFCFSNITSVCSTVFASCCCDHAFNRNIILRTAFFICINRSNIINCTIQCIICTFDFICWCLISVHCNLCLGKSIIQLLPVSSSIIFFIVSFCRRNQIFQCINRYILLNFFNHKIVKNQFFVSTKVGLCRTWIYALQIRCCACRINTKPCLTCNISDNLSFIMSGCSQRFFQCLKVRCTCIFTCTYNNTISIVTTCLIIKAYFVCNTRLKTEVLRNCLICQLASLGQTIDLHWPVTIQNIIHQFYIPSSLRILVMSFR